MIDNLDDNELNYIVDNVRSVFIFINRDGEILNHTTKLSDKFFGIKHFKHYNFFSLLNLKEDQTKFLKLCLDQIFEDVIPTQITLDMLPKRFLFKDKILDIHVELIRNPKKEPDKLLLRISDSTELVKAEEDSLTNSALISILSDINFFKYFLKEFYEMTYSLKNNILNNNQKEVRQTLHTIKGNLGVFKLFKLRNLVHKIENKSFISLENVESINNEMQLFLKTHKNLLKIEELHLTEEFSFKKDLIDRILLLKPELPQDIYNSIEKEYFNQIKSAIYNQLDLCAKQISQVKKKKINFTIKDHNININLNKFNLLFLNLQHLINNAVIHGIEDSVCRLSQLKNEVGNITLELVQTKNNLTLILKDDGQGIDMDKIKEKVIEKNLIKDDDFNNLPLNNKFKLIFLNGLSTTEHIDEYSGRGVGTSSVLSVIEEKYKGSIEIDSEKNKGTTFKILIPL